MKRFVPGEELELRVNRDVNAAKQGGETADPRIERRKLRILFLFMAAACNIPMLYMLFARHSEGRERMAGELTWLSPKNASSSNVTECLMRTSCPTETNASVYGNCSGEFNFTSIEQACRVFMMLCANASLNETSFLISILQNLTANATCMFAAAVTVDWMAPSLMSVASLFFLGLAALDCVRELVRVHRTVFSYPTEADSQMRLFLLEERGKGEANNERGDQMNRTPGYGAMPRQAPH